MLTPLVRRLVDYRAGWIPATAVLLAPFLATGVTAMPLLSRWKDYLDRRFAPFLLVISATVYGLGVGFLQHNRAFSISFGLLNLMVPLCFAMYLTNNEAEFGEIYLAVESTFVRCLVLTSFYGIYQFFRITPWDALWMENAGLYSIGFPAPMQVRVFSTLHSPQTFASFLVVGILFAVQSRSRLRYVAIPAGMLALALTLARTAWLGLAVALVYLLFLSTRRQRLVLAIIAASCLALFALAFQVPEVGDLIQKRVASMTDSQDASLSGRTSGYGGTFQTMLSAPFGQGVGFSESDPDSPAQKGTALGAGDSSIVAILFNFGFPGSFVYFVGLALVVVGGLSKPTRFNRNLLAPTAILLALLVEAPFTVIVAGPGGFLLWMSAALCLVLARISAREQLRAPGI
jgi:hypothetical protein